jgi:hypothetical protein
MLHPRRARGRRRQQGARGARCAHEPLIGVVERYGYAGRDDGDWREAVAQAQLQDADRIEGLVPCARLALVRLAANGDARASDPGRSYLTACG